MPRRPQPTPPVLYSSTLLRGSDSHPSSARLLPVVAGLGLAFGVLSFVITFWHTRLGLREGSLGLALVSAGIAALLVIGGALAVRWAVVPIEVRLRRQSEEARLARDELQAVIAASPLAIITLDAEGRVSGHWNPAAERLLGWTAAEVLGRPLPAEGGEDVQGLTRLREQILAGKPALNAPVRVSRRDGSAATLSLSTAVIPGEGDRPPEIVVVAADVTAEAATYRTLELQSTIIENLGDPVIAYDLANLVTYWNPAAEVFYGWTAAEMIGQYANSRLALEPIGLTLHEVKEHLVREGRFHGEFLQRRRDGSRVHVESRCTALRTASGEVTGYVSVSRDLAERERMAGQLRESEARFRRLSENAPDIIYRYRVRPTRGFEYVSPAAVAISGYTLDEFYADADLALELLLPEHHHVVEALATRPEVLEGKTLSLPWRRKDGGIVWIEQRNVLVRDHSGQVVAFEGIARDVTERKEMEDRYARLSQVVEQSAELVLVTDVDGTIVYVNPAFERMTGYAAEEAIGRNPRLLKSGLQGADFYRELWAALRRGESWAGRLRNRRKDGSLYVADAVMSPVRDRTGRVVNYVGLQRDMTRESELDDQLRQAQKMEAVGQLTGGIAHDFNNLLTVILANLALLREELHDVPGPVPQYLHDVQAAARRGSEMVRKLLAFGRQERLQPQPVDLPRLAMEFVRTVGRVLPETIEFHLTAADQLPAAMADPGAVEQILLNLATNARDAMPDGGSIELRMTAAAFDDIGERTVSGWHEPGRFVHLAFRDTGQGMDAATLERIFEPFFTTKPAGKGSGLGMPMVYGLMKQHGGFVTVTSAPGEGTTVHLYFPLATGDTKPRQTPAEGEETPGGTETLLLVEDEEPIRRVARRILEQLGYTVLEAEDGGHALEVYRGHADRIALLITDVVMPRLSGPELVARLRAEGYRVRALFATGYASSDVLGDDHLRSGALFIEKPWTVDGLARRVRQALDGPAR